MSCCLTCAIPSTIALYSVEFGIAFLIASAISDDVRPLFSRNTILRLRVEPATLGLQTTESQKLQKQLQLYTDVLLPFRSFLVISFLLCEESHCCIDLFGSHGGRSRRGGSSRYR